MKIFMHGESGRFADIFGMSDLVPKRTGLPVKIWVDHSGVTRKVSHANTPRVKIGNNDFWQVYTIEANPQLKESSDHIKHSEQKMIQKGVDYVARNYDLLLAHYYDTEDAYDDDDLKEDLRKRGDYR